MINFRAKILKEVPWDSIIDLVDVLSDSGLNDGEVAKEVADFLDMILDFKSLVKGPAGQVLEAIDGHVLLAAITVIIKLSKNGKQERKAKRTKILDTLKLVPNLQIKK